MKSVLRKRYEKPALLKHGLLKKLTLKIGSTADAFNSTGVEV